MRRLVVLVAVLAAACAAPAAGAGPILDGAVAALAQDPVYVDPDAERLISAAEADDLRARVAEADAGVLYVAILPAAARAEADGTAEGVVRALAARLGEAATYAVVVGDSFRAGSGVMPEGEAGELATQAFDENRGAGVAATLLAFVDLVSAAAAGGTEPAGGVDETDEGGGILPVLVPILAVGGIGFFLFRMFGRRRNAAAELAEVRPAAEDDLLALADDIRALDESARMPGANEEARRDLEHALEQYERADGLLDRARSAQDVEAVTQAVEEGRYALASAQARMDGREPPERRPPCFFDPRHGPSSREVEWTPPWGSARQIPVCEADAQRIEAGEEPEPRQVLSGGRRTAWWDASPAYGPWAGGYFGGAGGIFTGFLVGSILGDAVWPSDAGAAGDSSSDSFGDGDFGGGDFGGGDFGGGGGGDF